MDFVDSNIIPLCELITSGMFYVLCMLGLLTFLVIVTSPIFMTYYGLSGITIKLKQYKQKKSQERMDRTLQNANTDAYVMRLEEMVHSKPIKKKKKHK